MDKSVARSQSARSLSTVGKIAVAAAAVYAVRKLSSRKLERQRTRHAAGLQNQVVLITGGSRGLGLALAFEFGARGCRLALCARDEEELQQACRLLAEKGIEATPLVADINHQPETKFLIERIIQQFGRLDVLVNNAGEIQVAPLEALTLADFENAMNLMFWAPVNLSLAAIPYMAERHSGAIVNITSVGGRVSVPHLLPYSCAKFAFVGFSSGLAAEVKSRGIHVLTVVPGLMRTGSYLHAEFGGRAKKEFTWFGLLGNMPGLTVAADSAAKAILSALERKQYSCTISLPAKLLIGAETLMPDTTRTLMGFVSRILPDAAGPTSKGTGKQLNPQSNSAFQAFTALGKQAARTFNE